jgi:hypothetical protein
LARGTGVEFRSVVRSANETRMAPFRATRRAAHYRGFGSDMGKVTTGITGRLTCSMVMQSSRRTGASIYRMAIWSLYEEQIDYRGVVSLLFRVPAREPPIASASMGLIRLILAGRRGLV